MSIICLKGVSILNKVVFLSWKRLFARKLHENNNSFRSEKLINRKVLRIAGDDSCEFLQGLITNDMKNLQNVSSSIYTMFLNNKGRVLYDAFIYKTKNNNCFYLDCDDTCVKELVKHLKMYRVRRKIDICTINSEYSVWAVYDSKYIDNIRKSRIKEEVTVKPLSGLLNETQAEDIIVSDPRLSSLGYRALIASDDVMRDIPLDNRYNLCRHKLGVGEGVNEFQIGQSFPLEMNCDYLNGVSFDKGCYIGQELTARTFHTGVVRKRLMPVEFEREPKEVPYDTIFDYSGASRKSPLGKFKGYSGCFGLGHMRVSEALECKSFKLLDIKATATVPYWWPNISSQMKDVNVNI